MGYIPFFEICYHIYDLPTFKKQLYFTSVFAGIAIVLYTGGIIAGII